MKMQKLLENWNKFKSGVVREDLLNEISYEYAEHVEEWFADHGDELNLPFNDIFDGKSRVTIPLGAAMQPGSDMANILTWLEQMGYKTDFKTGLASKSFKSYTGKPGDPDTKEIMRLKQQKIGKVLQRARDIVNKITVARVNQQNRRKEFYDKNPDVEVVRYGAGPHSEDADYKRYTEQISKLQTEYSKHFRGDIYIYGKIDKWVDYWNKNSRYYRENPEEMLVDYSVVITRHPVDILRMSDHAAIQSCHSEGSDEFHCAVKEAKSAGAIAYIVETADLDQIDIDDDEIFEDDARGIDGIEPLGRVRLRRFDKEGNWTSDKKYSLLLPEKREYGISIPGLYDVVREWAVKGQESKWSEALREDGTIDPDYLRDFVRKGGQYSDTPPRSIFMHAFEEYGGKGFEHAEGGGWRDDQEEEERLIRGLDHYVEAMDSIVYNLESEARGQDNVKEDGLYVTNFEYKVINPQELGRRNDPEWDTNDSFEAAESENDPSYGPFPEVYFEATVLLRVLLNGSKADNFPSGRTREGAAVHDALEKEIRDALDFEASPFLSYYEMEEDYEGYLEYRVQFEGLTEGAERWHGGDHVRNHIHEFQEFVDALAADRENLPKLKGAMVSVLQQYEYAKPGFSDVLQKEIEEERTNFSKFILRPDNTGGYTLVYPMHGDPLLPDDQQREGGVVMEIPAGRMPTREILHATYGDVRKTGHWRVPSYLSPKFTRQVLGNMAKLFAQAHMSAKKQIGKQMSLPLQEQTEEGRDITIGDIQDYIASGFTLAMADVVYQKSSGTKQQKADFTPPTGVPRQTTLAVVRFVLDDEPHAELTYDQTEELFKAALNFVKMLDEDISLLSKEVTGVLQSLTHKKEGGYAQKGIEIKEMLNSVVEFGTKVDGELDALVMAWKNDPEKGNLPGIQNLLTPDKVAAGPGNLNRPSEARRDYYRGQIGRAFEGTIMSQYADDRLEILVRLMTIARILRNYDHPDEWSKFTEAVKAKHQKDLDGLMKQYKTLQTVEELMKLFESAPNLMCLIREETIKVIYG